MFAEPRCYSWIAVGIGGTLAITSTALSLAANAKQQAAINAARSTEAANQAALQSRSKAITNQSIKQSTPEVAKQEIQQGTDARTQLYNALKSSSVPVASALPATNNARTAATGNAWSNLVSGNQAKVGSYSDWESQQAIKNANVGQQLGIQNSFSSGFANLLPIQLQVANQAGDQLAGWGSIVGALGSAAMSSGTSRIGAGGGATGGGAIAPDAAPAYNPSAEAGGLDWSTAYQ